MWWPGLYKTSWQLPNTTLPHTLLTVCYRKPGGCIFQPRQAKSSVASLHVLVRLYWGLGWWERNKMHDCGLKVFMLKWLVSAHLTELSVLITVNTTGGSQTVWCMQRDVCTVGIEGLSIGSFKPAKYTTWVKNANKRLAEAVFTQSPGLCSFLNVKD